MKKNVLIVIFVCFLLCGYSRGQTDTKELSGQAVDYFFVCGGDIYFIHSMSTQEDDLSAEEMQQAGTLVCSDAGKEDSLGEDEKGRHEYIAVDGDRREYHAYNDLVETGQYECFVWEAERGLVGCWSGYGSRSQDIKLYLPGEEGVR